MRRLDLDRVVVDGHLAPVRPEAVDAAEAALGATFPVGYREYVTRLGEGEMNVLVRVLGPGRVLAELNSNRSLLADYWHWDATPAGFDEDAALRSIVVADTLDGDMILFDPLDPSTLIVAPRDSDELVALEPDLLEAVEWLCGRDDEGESTAGDRVFTPFEGRATAER